MEIIEIGRKTCYLFGSPKAESLILCGMENFMPKEIETTGQSFAQKSSAKNAALLIFETKDWNGELSPWPAKQAFGEEPFTGKGKETLQWIQETLLPFAKEKNWISKETKLYMAGYSLSGLFALWAFLETHLFDGVAACSSSLWMDGWMEYVETGKEGAKGTLYMSLGTKEEKTKNPLMRKVGDHTRETFALLEKEKGIVKSTLEWNPGGHFTEPSERLLKGMMWLLENQ